jgi:chromosome segregation ATPase
MAWRTDTSVSPPTVHLQTTASPDVPELLRQLAVQREELRGCRAKEQARLAKKQAKIAQASAQTERAQQAARTERMKAREVYGKFQARMKRAEAEHAEKLEQLVADREKLQAERDQFTDERTAFQTQLATGRVQLEQAWDLVTESQKRLAADREAAHAQLAQATAQLHEREAELHHDRAEFDAECQAWQSQVPQLQVEVERLESRANQMRAVLQNLEAERVSNVVVTSPTAVMLASQSGSVVHGDVAQFYEEVSLRDRELKRETAAMQAAHGELETKAAELFDARLVVAEQLAKLAVARQQWQATERGTLAELEALATQLTVRESYLDEREQELAEADESRLSRARDLWTLHQKLEGWQSTLSSRELALHSEQDRLNTEMTAKGKVLSEWEAKLTAMGREWAGTRKHELWQLRSELEHWEAARNQHRLALAEVDELRAKLLGDAQKMGAQTLAQSEATGTEPRRVRVLRKTWERHFHQFRRDLEARQQALETTASQADDRLRALTDSTTHAAHIHSERMNAHDAASLERIHQWRELEALATDHHLTQAEATRREAELATLRSEIHRLATTTTPQLQILDDVVALVAVG